MRRAEAWQGEAWQGKARRGEARLGLLRFQGSALLRRNAFVSGINLMLHCLLCHTPRAAPITAALPALSVLLLLPPALLLLLLRCNNKSILSSFLVENVENVARHGLQPLSRLGRFHFRFPITHSCLHTLTHTYTHTNTHTHTYTRTHTHSLSLS